MKPLVAFLSAVALPVAPCFAAPTIFDDFEVDEGRFNLQPTFSGTTLGIATTSTADRITTDAFTGGASQELVLNADGSSPLSFSRVRHLSGGGDPANNVGITISSGTTDGYIGYWAKTSDTGVSLSLYLDNGGSIDAGVSRALPSDGAWHLVEWNLDDDNDWVAASGIGGDGILTTSGTGTIDSIAIFGPKTGTYTVRLDTVAYNPDGSLSVIPEPASLALLGVAGLVLAGRRRR